jgi:Kunitz/Bovine pancreatic trypsin inhibitor domain
VAAGIPFNLTAAPTMHNGFCLYFPDPGPCIPKTAPAWFFDPVSQACQLFVYGGCRGNANRWGGGGTCLRHDSRPLSTHR